MSCREFPEKTALMVSEKRRKVSFPPASSLVFVPEGVDWIMKSRPTAMVEGKGLRVSQIMPVPAAMTKFPSDTRERFRRLMVFVWVKIPVTTGSFARVLTDFLKPGPGFGA